MSDIYVRAHKFCLTFIVRTHTHTQQTDCITRTTKWLVKMLEDIERFPEPIRVGGWRSILTLGTSTLYGLHLVYPMYSVQGGRDWRIACLQGGLSSMLCVWSLPVLARRAWTHTRGLFLGTESSLAGQAGSVSGHNDKCSIVFGVMATRFDLSLSLSLSLSPCLRLCLYMTVCVR